MMAVIVAGAGGCAAPPADETLRTTETVIGRARWRGHVAMLTDAPALLTVDAAGRKLTRTAVKSADAPSARLWGLAEQDGRLFTVSRFDRLVEIRPGGTVLDIAKLERPVANLIDLDAAMAVQPVGDAAGAPLMRRVDARGRLSAFESPLRVATGLAPSEGGLLQLLSCSVPPRPICWLPGVPRIFRASGHALDHGVALEGLPTPDAATLMATPERRVINDALLEADGGFLILRNEAGNGQRLTRFAPEGRPASEITNAEPLRLLVSSDLGRVVAVTRAGRLVTLVR